MKLIKNISAVLLGTVWISISEFVRNELLFKSFWIEHYQQQQLTFPDSAVNRIVWGIWSLLFAVAIFFITKRFTLLQATFIAWLMAFVMMWVVIGNLGMLPYRLLPYAVPLSILEAFIATVIIKKI